MEQVVIFIFFMYIIILVNKANRLFVKSNNLHNEVNFTFTKLLGFVTIKELQQL